MKKSLFLRLVLLLACATLLTFGCAKKPAPAPEAAAETPVVSERPVQEEVRGIEERPVAEAPVTDRAAAEREAAAAAAAAGLQRIFFDFDQYTLTPQARQTLGENAAFLKARPQTNVLVEGHADERGSDEYNLALGERRARAARDYLVSLGVAPERLSTISYGEERPLEPASNEQAWAKNRRAEFQLR